MKLTGEPYNGIRITYEADAARVKAVRKALQVLFDCDVNVLAFPKLKGNGFEFTTGPFTSEHTGRLVVEFSIALPPGLPTEVPAEPKPEPSRLVLLQ